MIGARRSSWWPPQAVDQRPARRASSPRATTTTPIPRGPRTGARSPSRRPATTSATTTTSPTSGWWPPQASGSEAGAPRRLTSTAGPAGHAAFSPAGDTIAYLGRAETNAFGGNIRLFAIPTAGGAPRCLTADFDRSCSPLGVQPVWSPDGGTITVAAEDQGSLGVYRVPADGGPVTRIVAGERVISGFSVSRDGRTIAFAASEPDSPAEVFVCGADGGGEKRHHRPQPGLEARGHAEPPGAIPLRAGRHDGGRLDHEDRSASRPAPAIPCS